tara:strand:+ start:1148 stop:1702 length:555 start_codon:yes stop_codon:yes gene_type:complete
MIEIYKIVSDLSPKFKEMAFGICKDENEINNAVQELMLYFLQMSPEVLSSIFKKDGKQGILRYGAVALRRALTSPRSAYYYKYKKYYTNINSYYTTDIAYGCTKIQNIPEDIEVNYDQIKLELIDQQLDNLDSWYDKKIFELYYIEDGGTTLDQLAEKTKISRNSLFTTIDKVRDILKEELVNE